MPTTIIQVNKIEFVEKILQLEFCFQLTKLYKNSNEKKYIWTIWKGFLSLLNNSNNDVMVAIAANLLNIFIAFSRNEDEGLLQGSICSISTVRNMLLKIRISAFL